AATAAETVLITHEGHYTNPANHTVSLHAAIQLAIENTFLITPTQSRSLRQRADALLATRTFQTTFDVTDQTTLAAARRLVDRFGPDRVAALVAQCFADALLPPAPYARAFEHVTFAILDRTGENLAPFAARFSPAPT